MNIENRFKKALPFVIGGFATFLAFYGAWAYLGKQSFVQTALSGLTLGSLFFMVAAGLTLIFGLMDVLNFTHGAMFMVGAYIGWQFYTNPTFIFGMAPLIFAFAAGILLNPVIKPYLIRWEIDERWQKNLPRIGIALAVILGLIGIYGFDILSLADTAMVANTTSSTNNPLMEISAQESLVEFWYRPLMLFLSGGLIAFVVSRPGDKTQFAPRGFNLNGALVTGGLLICTLIATFVRESAPEAVLLMNGNWRFLLSIITAIIFGLLLGAVSEITLIRPLYQRPFFIVLMTLGMSYVIRETVQLLWDPLAYQMVRPPMFNQEGTAQNLLDLLQNHYSKIKIMGANFTSYWLFIIFLGFLMFIFIYLLMTKTRLGMIIRAGVQDPEIVEAMGINIRSIFTLVFALGVALAALGGIGAAPFFPVEPLMGDRYQMLGFITVVLGGMGSYVGAFIGAMLLGMARAFGSTIALDLDLSTALVEASTVIIMVIVLLIRPQGLFGKKD